MLPKTRSGAPFTVVTNWRDRKHPEAGGAEEVCERLALALVAQGHRVILLTSSVEGAPRTEVVDGYTVRRSGGRFTVYAAALIWLFLHRRQVAMVVDSQNGIPFFTPLAVRRRTPVALLLHHVHQDQFALYFSPLMAWVGRHLESTVSRGVYGRRAILVVSPSTREGARTRLGLRGAIHVAPPGWEVTLDPRRESDMPLRSSRPSVAVVGRLVPHKRTHLVIQAVAELRDRLPDLELRIVGGGPELEALRQLADDAGLTERTTFYPGCSDAVRDEVLASSWLSVNASQGEGWGLSVIEANALGVPVLAFSRPGLRDSISPGVSGWLIEDDESLADTIAAIVGDLSDEVVASSYRKTARDWAQQFTWEQMAQRVTRALDLESRRLNLDRSDRRRSSDLATVVRIAPEAVPDSWEPRLRDEDQMSRGAEGLVVFLSGVDTVTAPKVLERIGLPMAAHDQRVQYRVARRRDHLQSAVSWD